MRTEQSLLNYPFQGRGNLRNLSNPLQNGLCPIVFLLLFLTTNSVLADSAAGDLVINVSGFQDSSGQAMAYLFHKGDNVLEKPKTTVSSNIINGAATMTFSKLSYGTYAVTVYHDRNGNGVIDHNLLHIPAEPLGFSNGFKLGLFSGMPSFEKLQFSFSTETKPLEIVVK